MKYLARLILKIIGWKAIININDLPSKAVLIQAPHTSAWDFVFGRLGLYSHGVKIKTMVKKESFYFPMGLLLRAMGAFPIDRASSQKSIKYVAGLFAKKENFILLMAPEGTRKLNKRWKKGFYFVAEKANVPILLGYLCYDKKVGGIGPAVMPTGDYEEDMRIIENFYQDKVAKYPENFNLSKENRAKEESQD
jgi:1-acyl-sn-glycerol-3-phosphate acyltransferase